MVTIAHLVVNRLMPTTKQSIRSCKSGRGGWLSWSAVASGGQRQTADPAHLQLAGGHRHTHPRIDLMWSGARWCNREIEDGGGYVDG